MDQHDYDALLRRLVAVSEKQETTLASLNTKQQRVDLTLIALDETTAAIRELRAHHEATFERLARLLDERLPPPPNGR